MSIYLKCAELLIVIVSINAAEVKVRILVADQQIP
jgi:hypothetical protein